MRSGWLPGASSWTSSVTGGSWSHGFAGFGFPFIADDTTRRQSLYGRLAGVHPCHLIPFVILVIGFSAIFTLVVALNLLWRKGARHH
jgi:hypothetical protein